MKPDKRTIFVLVSLVVAMTICGGILLVLEPRPVAPFSGVALQVIDRLGQTHSQNKLFDTPASRNWQAIVIHDSGSSVGSAETLATRNISDGGLGYDFVVNNGSLKSDGLLEIGYRWRKQLAGNYLSGKNSKWFNDHAIGICMIGNGDKDGFTKSELNSLVWLVRKLQGRYKIPKDHIYIDVSGSNSKPAGTFPHVWFRKQLLTISATY